MRFVTLLFLALSASAHADDSFEIVKNGQTYLCSPEASDPNGAADCADKAYHGPFSREEATRLCAGSRSTAPADCAIATYHGPFSKEESIQICKGAILANGPSDCAIAAYHGPFSKDESVRLCAGNTTLATAQCAIRAYAGPYNKEQAIQLCRNGNPALMSVGLSALLEEARLGYGAVVDQAKLKALRDLR